MRPTGRMTNFAPGKGGVERDPMTLASHSFHGINDSAFLSSAVEMEVTAGACAKGIDVDVRITNVGAGHFVPTGLPMRHMLLLVRAIDAAGRDLDLMAGDRLPDWAGIGDDPNDYAGRPGRWFGRLIYSRALQKAPVPFWAGDAEQRQDTRIAPLAADHSRYRFTFPATPGPVRVTATLLFRRTYKEWSDAKKWDIEDKIMARREQTVRPDQ